MKDEVVKIIDKLIKKGKASPEAIKLLEDIVDKMDESKKEGERVEMLGKLDSIIEASKVDNTDVIEAIKQIKLIVPAPQVTVEPAKVEVNVPKQDKPVVNVPQTKIVVPDEVKIKRPTWIDGLINLQPIIDVIESIKAFIPVFPKEPKDPVSVRLSDGEKFYKAISTSSGSAAIPTFKNSAGEVKQAIVDDSGNVQVDIVTMPDVVVNTGDIEIGAVELKDSNSDTRATVGSNGLYVDVQSSILPTGASTSIKQNDQIALETTLNSLIETLQELTQRLEALAGTVANTAQLRVVQTSVPSTAVTGPITSAQSIAEKAVGGISYAEKMAITNLTAVQSNINNTIGA